MRPVKAFIGSVIILFLLAGPAKGQVPRVPGAPLTAQNAPGPDTTEPTNTSTWRDEQAFVYHKKLDGQIRLFPDTMIHRFHRRPFSQPFLRDLGNLGTAGYNLLFTPEYRTGPTLGFNVFRPYRMLADSMLFYHTNRPYTNFIFNLGSKGEQLASILHTQNIHPRWNVAVQYRRITSPGFYKIQRTNHDAAAVTTNYYSKKQHYQLQATLVYNKMQQDENGGQTADSFLRDASFSDRKTIPVRFQNDAYSVTRSSVSNVQRDFTILLHHSYALGRMDTLYNEDSTQYAFRLTPRFRFGHRFRLHSEKHFYKDLAPDSLRYDGFFQRRFASTDSVYAEQDWLVVDNAFLVEGLIGPRENQVMMNAGFGIRADQFSTNNGLTRERNNILSNYLIGELRKEASQDGGWNYEASARLFLTGEAAGNFLARAQIGRSFSKERGFAELGFQQALNNAPFNYQVYRNTYYLRNQDFSNESVTQVYATALWRKTGIAATLRNYLIGNYIYLNESQAFGQYTQAFNITQVMASKVFYFGSFVFDNEVAWQQKTGNAPVNIPAVMGRHQFSLERYVFGKTLKIATGIDLRWHSDYQSPGYSPFFNRFFYQNQYTVSNVPEASVFFTFKVKNFRAYLMGDQLQQTFTRNNINFPGYPAQNAMIRFGFSWVMIN